MGNFLDQVSSILMIGGIVALVYFGVKIAKPNIHAMSFEMAKCNITSIESPSDFDDLPRCSCGKNCKEEYPCVILRGYYMKNDTIIEGTFYKDYEALEKECLVKPKCYDDFEDNAKLVYQYYEEVVLPKVNDSRYPFYNNYTFFNYTDIGSEFDCWGSGSNIYFDHNYSMVKAYLALILPTVLIVLGLIITCICGSDSHKNLVKAIISIPFICLCMMCAFLCEMLPRECGGIPIMNIVTCNECIPCKRCYARCCRGSHEHSDSTVDIHHPGDEVLEEAHHSSESGTISYNTATTFDFPTRYDIPPPLPGYNNPPPSAESSILPPPPSYQEVMLHSTSYHPTDPPTYQDVSSTLPEHSDTQI